MEEDLDVGAPPPEESGNRVFLIGTIILGGVFLIALIAIVVLFLLTRGGAQPQPPAPDLTATAVFQVVGTQTAANATQMQKASQTAAVTATRTQTLAPTNTLQPSSTPVVFSTLVAVTNTMTAQPSATGGAATATGTLAGTTTPVRTATALPKTGFADSAGLPGLLVLGLLLMVVIILARQLRLSGRRS